MEYAKRMTAHAQLANIHKPKCSSAAMLHQTPNPVYASHSNMALDANVSNPYIRAELPSSDIVLYGRC